MNLRGTLIKALDGDSKACAELVRLCKNMALAYLRQKLRRGDDFILRFTGNLEDLAWDCIADLFERDSKENLIQLNTYFSDLNLKEANESKIESELRRLIFSQINDGLFRNFGSFDNSLRKIIRNLKRGAQIDDGLTLSSELQDKHIQFGKADGAKEFMPPELIKIRLSQRIGKSMYIPDILDILKGIFRDQHEYRKSYPITRIAICIRSVYASLNKGNGTADKNLQTDHLMGLKKRELEDFLDEILERQKEQFIKSYVESGKMAEDKLESYLQVVKDILKDGYIRQDPEADANFEHFKKYFNGIDKHEYRDDHRNYVEYFTRTVKNEWFTEIRKEL